MNKTKVEGFEKWLMDFRRNLADSGQNKKLSPLHSLAWLISVHKEELINNPDKMRQLLEGIRALRESNGSGRQVVERQLMKFLAYLVMEGCQRLGKEGDGKFLKPDDFLMLTGKLQPIFEIMQQICSYAIDCFHFKRPRDSFGGRRRALAFEIFAVAGEKFDLPGAVSLACEALQKKDSEEAAEAAAFLEEYYGARKTSPDPKTVKALERLADRTGSHTIAMSALNALVQTGEMSEMGALIKIEDWKEKRWRNC